MPPRSVPAINKELKHCAAFRDFITTHHDKISLFLTQQASTVSERKADQHGHLLLLQMVIPGSQTAAKNSESALRISAVISL
jgi:gluconate kinase